MALAASRFELPHERQPRLRALGLTEEIAANALVIGVTKQRACTPLHPRGFPESVLWGETSHGWRVQLLPRGWEVDDTDGLPRVVNRRLGVAIVVATGCSNTGRRDRETEPRTKNRKGRAAGLAIEDNGQMSLLGSPDEDAKLPELPLRTWYHLISNDGTKLWHELSLAKGRDRAGHIVSWYERIFCEPIEISEVASQAVPGTLASPVEDSPEIDVSVERIR